MNRNLIVLATLIFIGSILSGCVIARSTTMEERGRKIGESTLNQLEDQVTTQDWVRAVLGEPTRSETVSEGKEVWVYEYMLKKENRVGVIVLLSSEDQKVESQSVFLEFQDGILSKHWTEK